MLSNNRLRVFGALVFSLTVHLLALVVSSGGDQQPTATVAKRKVTIQLAARRSAPERAVVTPTRPEMKREQVAAVLPILAQPVEVAVREIPALSLPVAPRVPEPDHHPAPPVAEFGETGQPAIVMARPLYRENPPPTYPARARRRNLQGTVVLEVAVSSEGTVDGLEIHESSGHNILDRAALAAVGGWVFEPGRRNGEKVAMAVLVPVRFSLR